MNKILKIVYQLVITIAFVAFIAGLMGFLTPFAYLLPRSFGNIELPLAKPNQIAVSKNGLIYCGLEMYSKIQIYDQNGNFVKGWFLDTGGRVFGISINENQLNVVSFANIHYFYDLYGNLIREENHGDPTGSSKFEEDLSGLKGGGKGPVYDKMRNSYFIQSHWLFPKIIKKPPSGKENILVSSPKYLALLTPIPAIFIVFFMTMAYVLIEKKLNKLEKNSSQ